MRSDNKIMEFMVLQDLRQALKRKDFGFLNLLYFEKLRIEVENKYQEMIVSSGDNENEV